MAATEVLNLSPETLLGAPALGRVLAKSDGTILAANRKLASLLRVGIEKLLCLNLKHLELAVEVQKWLEDGNYREPVQFLRDGRILEFSLIASQNELLQLQLQDVTERAELLLRISTMDRLVLDEVDVWNRRLQIGNSLKILVDFHRQNEPVESTLSLIRSICGNNFPQGGCIHSFEDGKFNFITSWGQAAWKEIGSLDECIATSHNPGSQCDHLGSMDGYCVMTGKLHMTVLGSQDHEAIRLLADTVSSVLT